MLRFLVDTQLPPRLSNYLLSKGFDSIHTTHFKNGHLLQDSDISIIAKTEIRIIITKDADFLDRFTLYGAPPKVLLLQFGNISNKDLINHFESELKKLTELFLDGNDLIIFNEKQIICY